MLLTGKGTGSRERHRPAPAGFPPPLLLCPPTATVCSPRHASPCRADLPPAPSSSSGWGLVRSFHLTPAPPPSSLWAPSGLELGPSGEGALSSIPANAGCFLAPRPRVLCKPAPGGLTSGNRGSLSPWKAQAGLTQVCDTRAEAKPLHFGQLPPAPSSPEPPPRGCWGLSQPHLPPFSPLQPLCIFCCFCRAPHPQHPAGSPLPFPEDLLEASEVTLEGEGGICFWD